jgi:N-acetylneuraminic acid mutarotase
MMVRRRHHTGVCYNNKLYVFGGSLGKITADDLLTPSAECYDPATRRWNPLRPPSVARANGRAIVVDAHAYVMGGSILGDQQAPDNKKTLFTTSVECYDIEHDMWLPVAWKLPHQAVSFSAKYTDGRILVAGGWMGGPVGTTHIMDMTTSTWTQLAKLPEAVDKCAHC